MTNFSIWGSGVTNWKEFDWKVHLTIAGSVWKNTKSGRSTVYDSVQGVRPEGRCALRGLFLRN